MASKITLDSSMESRPQPERTRERGPDDDGAAFQEHLDRLRGRPPRNSNRDNEVVLFPVHKHTSYRPRSSRPSSYERIRPTSRSGEEKKQSSRELSVGGYQLVLSPQNAKDCTLHFEMDIENDLEVQLEEFSRLKRLDRFGAAREIFQRDLAEHTAYSLPVLIEHADMLYEQGHYRGFFDLVFGYRRRLVKRDFSALERLLFELNEALAETLFGEHPAIKYESHLAEANALFFEVQNDINSIELQLFNRLLRIWVLREGEEQTTKSIRRVVELIYRPVSKALIAEERFWELKDFVAEIANVNIDDAWLRMFTNSYGSSSLQGIIDDFTPGPYVESSSLAPLDVIVALSGYPLSKQSFMDHDSLSATGYILQRARQVASTIETKSPDLVRSRPYLRWILAEAEHSRRFEGDVIRQHFSRFPGVTVYRSLVPIYIPRTCENPGWPEVPAYPQYTRLVHIALKTARAMEDYQTEVLCLQELICRSSHSHELFKQLKQRRREMEGNSVAYRKTCLSMYLLQGMGSPHSLEALLNKYHLANSPTQSVSRRTQDGLTQWCYVMLQRAFAIYTRQEENELEDEAFRIFRKLPYDVSSLVDGGAIIRCPRPVPIPSSYESSSDSGSDYFSTDISTIHKGSFRHRCIMQKPHPRSVDVSPAIDAREKIDDSKKATGVDQMVQTDNSGENHIATPHMAIDKPSTGASEGSGPVQDKQPHEVDEPPEDNPPKQAHIHESSSSSE